MIGSNAVKDMLAHRLECIEPGKGMYRTADWLPDFVYSELCAEVRDTKGWQNPLNRRNESWDTGYYAIALCISPLLGLEQINWESPPAWAADWDTNTLVTAPNVKTRFEPQQKSTFDFAKLAGQLA
jgi:phage terminase large subunit GpA-like protein